MLFKTNTNNKIQYDNQLEIYENMMKMNDFEEHI